MRFSRYPDDYDFREAPCTVCGGGTRTESAVFADLSEDDPDGFLAEAFCSWEHFGEWVAKGRPEPDRWERLDDDDNVMMLEDWWFRVRYSGVGSMLSNIRAGLATYGLYVLTQRWAAKHPDAKARLDRRFPRLTRLLGAPEKLHR